MKRNRLPYLIVTLLLVLAFGALVLRPVPIVAEAECEVAQGKVVHVFEGGAGDIVLVLESQAERFYINRGLEKGLDLELLRSQLIDSQVKLWYPSYWTPLDPTSSTRHISKMTLGESVLFDETK